MQHGRFWGATGTILLITTGLWLLSKPADFPYQLFWLLSLGQLSALLGTVLLAITLLLSTRLNWIEDIFGGLDKVFRTHHWLGIGSFSLLVAHPILLSVELLPDFRLFASMFWFGPDLAQNLGVMALYTMVFSFVFIGLIKLPYNWWLWTHRVIGLSILFGGVHAMMIGSDVGADLALRYWMMAWIVVGSIAAIYSIIFYKTLGPRFFYQLVKVVKRGDVVELVLAPQGRKRLQFQAGQFVSLSLNSEAVSRESHPFSVVSAPGEEHVRLAAKQLGDYTNALSNAQPGDLAVLHGPHGRLGTQLTPSEVWVAGGIGVTPFISMAKQLMNLTLPQTVTLFYCVRTAKEAVFARELQDQAAVNPRLKVIVWESAEKGRLSVEQIDQIAHMARVSLVRICGPRPMMYGLADQLTHQGHLSAQQIKFEDFALVV